MGAEIRCAWVRTVDPVLPVVTMDEAKAHARVSDTNSDSVIQSYIETATGAAEDALGRGLLTQTWSLVLDGWASVIPLPMAAPLQSVTSVKYYDTSGVQQTLSTTYYDIDTVARPGRVVLKAGQSWPSAQAERRNGVIEIVYVCGWTDPALVPERIKQGIKQYVTYLDADRDGTDPNGLAALQAAHRCWSDRIEWTAPEWCR